MQENLKKFIIKGTMLLGTLLLVIILFKFPVDYFNLRMLSSNSINSVFSKSDALKVLGIALVFFTMYYKEKISKIEHIKQKKFTATVWITAGILVVGAYYLLRYLAYLYNITSGTYYYLVYIASFMTLILGFVFFTIGIFTFEYLKQVYAHLKKELFIAAALSIITYFLLMGFQNLWWMFSNNITMVLYTLFAPLFPTYIDWNGSAPLLDVNGFVVSIGAPCSGTESMFLFAVFTVGLYLLDRNRIKKRQFIIASILGLIGTYLVNIIRLFLLILTGVYVNPDFAVGMFHANIGWLLFVIYFFIYYYIMRKFIYKHNISKE
ncbi:MAG: archaeosortase/exosortase family protein [Candidatus Woesearchaeota archaeon]